MATKINDQLIISPKIGTSAEKKFVGMRIIMSFSNNKTFELWRSFMPRRKEIQNSIGTELYSIEIFTPTFFSNFNPNAEFEKWAAVEVRDFQIIPGEMETMISPEGLYAVFLHNGPASTGSRTYKYIFTTWLPNSDFLLDDRPHFAIMGEKYKDEDQNSEEEILIPIKHK